MVKAIREINRREGKPRESGRRREATKGRTSNILPEVLVLKGMTEIEEIWNKIKEEDKEPDK